MAAKLWSGLLMAVVAATPAAAQTVATTAGTTAPAVTARSCSTTVCALTGITSVIHGDASRFRRKRV